MIHGQSLGPEKCHLGCHCRLSDRDSSALKALSGETRVAMLKERRLASVRTSTIRVNRPPDVGGWSTVGRSRRFAELEALILAKELERTRIVWDVSAEDRRFRLQGLERTARRQGQLAESARLAQVRRRSLVAQGELVALAGARTSF